MPQLHPLSTTRHATIRWQRFTSYAFAGNQAVVPLAMAELPRAVGTLPIAFTATATGCQLVSVLGQEPGRNLFIAADGSWRGHYVPAQLRGHPFYLAPSGNGRYRVAIDEASGLVGETGGEALFDAEGNPSDALQPVLRFLKQLAQSRIATDQACQALGRYGLLEPWSVAVTDEQGATRYLKGLYRIREAGLNELGGEALAELRDAAGLWLAYGQLLGQSAFRRLSELARQAAREPGNQPSAGLEFSQVFGSDDGLDFDWSQLDE